MGTAAFLCPLSVMQDTWDIQNPARVTLPSSNAAVCYDVKCIAAVGNNEIWVGAGPSIFFLDEQSLERCVSSVAYSCKAYTECTIII